MAEEVARSSSPPPPPDNNNDDEEAGNHEASPSSSSPSPSPAPVEPPVEANENDSNNNDSSSPKDDTIDMEDVRYGMESFLAIVKPVFLTMILTALAVVFVTTPESQQATEAALSNTYKVLKPDENTEASNGQQLGTSLVNGLVIVSVICFMTFVIVLLYKYQCMKCLLGYMIFSTTLLLSILAASMFQVFLEAYTINLDVLSFWYLIYNFALVGTASIFWTKGGLPGWTTQGYLIAISVIVAWQLSHFDPWTAWVLLVLLALYDLFAVLTPCGPLKALVKLMQRDNAPTLPGLLYEAHLPRRRTITNSTSNQRRPTTTTTQQQQPQQPSQNTNGNDENRNTDSSGIGNGDEQNTHNNNSSSSNQAVVHNRSSSRNNPPSPPRRRSTMATEPDSERSSSPRSTDSTEQTMGTFSERSSSLSLLPESILTTTNGGSESGGVETSLGFLEMDVETEDHASSSSVQHSQENEPDPSSENTEASIVNQDEAEHSRNKTTTHIHNNNSSSSSNSSIEVSSSSPLSQEGEEEENTKHKEQESTTSATDTTIIHNNGETTSSNASREASNVALGEEAVETTTEMTSSPPTISTSSRRQPSTTLARDENAADVDVDVEAQESSAQPAATAISTGNDDETHAQQTGRIPLAIAKLYQLPLRDNPEPIWIVRRRQRREQQRQQRQSSSGTDNENEGSHEAPPSTQEPAEDFSVEELRGIVDAVFPRHGGRIVPHEQQRRGAETRYCVLNRNGETRRILFVKEENGRVFEDPNHEETAREERKERNSIRLGLGDFIFYSILVAKAALYSWTTFAACTLSILTGLGLTLLMLAVRGHALPALPISIFLGVVFYLITRYGVEPFIQQIFIEQTYV